MLQQLGEIPLFNGAPNPGRDGHGALLTIVEHDLNRASRSEKRPGGGPYLVLHDEVLYSEERHPDPHVERRRIGDTFVIPHAYLREHVRHVSRLLGPHDIGPVGPACLFEVDEGLGVMCVPVEIDVLKADVDGVSEPELGRVHHTGNSPGIVIEKPRETVFFRIGSWKAKKAAPTLHEYRERRGQDLVDLGVPLPTVERLRWLYGRQLDHLIALGAEDASWLELLHPDIPALRGEVYHAVEQEMALTLTDFMDRRAALLLFSENFGLAAAEAAADIMGDLLGWDGERRNREVADYRLLASGF